jgi:Leucine-rich repeat (LRR) protein
MKIIITEGQLKNLKESFDLDKIKNLVKTGDYNNISIALEISKNLSPEEQDEIQDTLLTTWLNGYFQRAYSFDKWMKVNPKTLIIRDKDVGYIPKNIFKLNPKRLAIFDTDITEIPETLGQIQRLKSLEIPNNNLTTIPNTIFNLPNLTRLSLEGNPISKEEIERIKRNLPNTEIHY